MVDLPDALRQRMLDRLRLLYGPVKADTVLVRLEALLAHYEAPAAHTPPGERVSERDVLLITYGDLLRRSGEAPLHTLLAALSELLSGVINGVHVLPFFPYSSDDGFSVIDYLAVDRALGEWEDIERLGASFRLMFDAVINHMSVESEWFRRFLADDPAYRDFFITADREADLSSVTRPRTTPLLTPFESASGTRHVWTTFSDDQVDLNYANPDVLLAVIGVLLEYVARRASLIRLDAIAYLWKEIGTSCIHLPQTHAAVQLIRDVLDAVAPDVLIITETNVPHAENVSYFGDGRNEAQLVYQFSLPPLVVHSFRTGNASALSHWASSLESLTPTTTFFNFTASHDGIGVRPAAGLVGDADVEALTALAVARGGQVSYKTNSDGSQSPYELNITYVDAILDPAEDSDPAGQAQRFLASQAVMLAFQGVPGIYFHSLLGSRNWMAGVAQTGRARSINREKLDYEALRAELDDPGSLRHFVFHGYRDLIRIRTGQAAFHPNAAQAVLDVGEAIFGLRRTSLDGQTRIVALHNVSGVAQSVTLDAGDFGGPVTQVRDLIGEIDYLWFDGLNLELAPYQVMWLKAE